MPTLEYLAEIQLLNEIVRAAKEYRDSEIEYATEYKRVGKERSEAFKRGEYISKRDSWKPHSDRINTRKRRAKDELDRLLSQWKDPKP